MTGLERAGHRIGSGAGIVVTGIAAWPSRAANGEKKLGRWIVLGGSGWLTEQLVARTHPFGLVVAAGFIAGAWRNGTPPEPDDVEDADGRAHDVEDDLVPAPSRDDLRLHLVDTITQLAGTARGVHLRDVHQDWLDKGLLRNERTLSEFRRFTEGLGIPVRDSLKVSGDVAIGVRLADLPQPARTPPPAPERTPS